jgi:hypothetical protein
MIGDNLEVAIVFGDDAKQLVAGGYALDNDNADVVTFVVDQ